MKKNVVTVDCLNWISALIAHNLFLFPVQVEIKRALTIETLLEIIKPLLVSLKKATLNQLIFIN